MRDPLLKHLTEIMRDKWDTVEWKENKINTIIWLQYIRLRNYNDQFTPWTKYCKPKRPKRTTCEQCPMRNQCTWHIKHTAPPDS